MNERNATKGPQAAAPGPMIGTLAPSATPTSRVLRFPLGRRAPPVALDPGSMAGSAWRHYASLDNRPLFIEDPSAAFALAVTGADFCIHGPPEFVEHLRVWTDRFARAIAAGTLSDDRSARRHRETRVTRSSTGCSAGSVSKTPFGAPGSLFRLSPCRSEP
jgi:hypothetical protein